MIPSTPEYAVALAMLICTAGAAVTLATARHRALAGWIAFGVLALSGLLALLGAASVLLTEPSHAETLFTARRLGFSLRLYVDGLSAVFLILIATVSILAALYSIEYMQHRLEHGVGRYYPNLLLFVAAMYGLVSTTDMMYFFFIFWQMMTLTGYALIRYEPRKPENLRAANRYLWMMQLACGVTMLGAALIAHDSVVTPGGETLLRFDFDAVSHHLPQLLIDQPARVTLAFALFLVGFGIKLGVWPFGRIWLPDAHPAAPSPISALLSGVMIKTGIYGLMRYFIWLVPGSVQAEFPLMKWGLVLAALGTVTLFTGTAQALRQEQSKRLLAYSSIGQAGYLVLALGVCLTLLSSTQPLMPALAATALLGALFHTLNHGVFKSLLFLNAGSVLHATGTQDLNKLGGMLRYMPVTGGTALVASCAIAGVPLFSGFASKWTIYTAAIQGHAAAPILALCAAIAILTSTLTLALFIKFFGAIFLSRTSVLVHDLSRRPQPLEVGWKMRLPQVILLALCLFAGLFPGLMLQFLSRVLQTSRQGLAVTLADAVPASVWTGPSLQSPGHPAVYVPLIVALVFVLMCFFARWLASLGGATRRISAPWLCGYAVEGELNRYRAGHLFDDLKNCLGRKRPPAPVPLTERSAPGQPSNPIPPWSPEKN
ncbi:MAG: peroxiredoxin family protein [Verrucomicrobia bacterium]|nr:peroxiredoxin family protein [Verrucomicrobiota bacterium]